MPKVYLTHEAKLAFPFRVLRTTRLADDLWKVALSREVFDNILFARLGTETVSETVLRLTKEKSNDA